MPYLPFFPLNLVAFPGELLNLHIFEPRYRQLIGECLEDDTTFGIPVYMNNLLPGYGTEMAVSELVERYDDGRLDIRTRGIRVFKTVHFQNPAPGRLYAQGEVHFYAEPETDFSVLPELQLAVERLYALLKMQPEQHKGLPQPFSYQIAHRVGLPIEGEYELLTLETEVERQAFVLDHLNQTLPVLEDMERTKERIRMNGHFREFGELDF
jgi:hypothetical protein